MRKKLAWRCSVPACRRHRSRDAEGKVLDRCKICVRDNRR